MCDNTHANIEPNVFILVLLPPLIYESAAKIDWFIFRRFFFFFFFLHDSIHTSNNFSITTHEIVAACLKFNFYSFFQSHLFILNALLMLYEYNTFVGISTTSCILLFLE
jgi:hypothetical protein